MKKIFFVILALGAMVFAGCQKENNVAYLTATISNFETSSDSKVFIDDAHYACWNTSGDQVRINSSTQDVTLTANDGKYRIAVAAGDQSDEMFYSIYPASAVNGDGELTSPASVTLPAIQLYQEADNKQKVEALMAAMGTSILDFKNICALLCVQVTGIPEGAHLTKIEVSTLDGKPLCGTGNVTFTASDNITLGTLNGGSTVKLQFDIDTKGNGYYYIVLPPTSNTGLDVSVHFRKSNTTAGATQLYTKRLKQTISNDQSYTLAANNIYGVTFDLSGTDPVEHLPGAFSVSSTRQVYFSPGSLKYTSNNGSNPAWSFENDQLTATGYDAPNNGSHVNYTGYMPIWVSGMSFPKLHDNSESGTIIDYGTFAVTASAGAWSTLSTDEWDFLFARHSNSIGSPLGTTDHACYAYVQVNDVYGIMLFPDLFQWPIPSTNSSIPIPGTLNAASSNYNGINYTTAQWKQLEDAGCVFLPALGYWDHTAAGHSGNGYYWTSTPKEVANNNKNAYYMYFASGAAPNTGDYRSYGDGLLVRLVYDPNATSSTNTK